MKMSYELGAWHFQVSMGYVMEEAAKYDVARIPRPFQPQDEM